MKELSWRGCYKNGWKGILTPESFVHPAKVSYRLAERIYSYLMAEGLLREGDRVLDPFGGIGGFAFSALTRGLDWTGIELEPRFVTLGQANLEKWEREYAGKLPRWGTARLVQGDSRELKTIVDRMTATVSSPPYAATDLNGKRPNMIKNLQDKLERGELTGRESIRLAKQGYLSPHEMSNLDTYGTTPGQLGAMPAGDLAAAISSPPYSEARIGQESGQEHCPHHHSYGSTPGQLGSMRAYPTKAKEAKEIPLTQGKVALVSEDDFERVSQFKWYATRRANVWYAARTEKATETEKKKVVYLHRFILGVDDGVWVDHINHDGLDCRRENLHSATMSQNLANRPKTNGNTSGYKGVYYRKDRGTWKASIEVDGKQISLGTFHSQEEAARAYDAAAVKHFGEFAHLNFDPRGDGFSASISSPPYAESVVGSTDYIERMERLIKEPLESLAPRWQREVRKYLRERKSTDNGQMVNGGYGQTPGQLGAMKAAVSSPPYEACDHNKPFSNEQDRLKFIEGQRQSHPGRSEEALVKMTTRWSTSAISEEGLGNSSGDDFWSAARTIVAQTYAVLVPGGTAAWVVKSFVRDHQIVDFPGQWRTLCESVGFETFAVARAWLVEDHGTQLAQDGNHKRLTKSRKSFFRRLAESKGAPAIDYEVVLFMRKAA